MTEKSDILRHSCSIAYLDMAINALVMSAALNTGDDKRNNEMDAIVSRLEAIREEIAGGLNDLLGNEAIE